MNPSWATTTHTRKHAHEFTPSPVTQAPLNPPTLPPQTYNVDCEHGSGLHKSCRVEPLEWGLWDDPTQLKEGGLVAIDFVNAFNTISRHVMADSIRKHMLLQCTQNAPRTPWPTDQEVSQYIEQQTADRIKRFQERSLDPPRRLHPDIEKARTFRQMAWARSVRWFTRR